MFNHLDGGAGHAVRLLGVCMVGITCLLSSGCGLVETDEPGPPLSARIELTGNASTAAQVVFSSSPQSTGDDRPLFLAADTVRSGLPFTREFGVDGPEFWLIVTRYAPTRDNMGIKVWAGDFLFVDSPVLPDTQTVVEVLYRHSAARF